nr:putative capsid [Marmot picobirnavirus]
MNKRGKQQSKWGRSNGRPNRKDQARKGRGQTSAGEDSRPDRRDDKMYTGASNPFEWYNRYANLTAAVAQVSYPYRPGMTIPFMHLKSPDSSINHVYNYSIPGVITIDWVPTAGTSEYPTSPASLVGKDLFSRVREKFSGSIEIDPPDFFIYVMALDAPFSYIAFLKRLYRTLVAYTPENFITPDGLLLAYGVHPNAAVEIKRDRKQLLGNINELIGMSRRLHIPKNFDILNRHYWMNDHVFADAPGDNVQNYVFVQKAWYKFNPNMQTPVSDLKAGGLELVPLEIPMTGAVDYLFDYGKALFDALFAEDDTFITSGYLAKAFEGQPEFYIDELSDSEPLTFEYDEVVLSQIENASALPCYGTLSNVTLNITQNPLTNAIISVPKYTSEPVFDSVEPIFSQEPEFQPTLSCRSTNPTIIENIEMTRLKQGWRNLMYDKSTKVLKCDLECGTELVMGYTYIARSVRGDSVETLALSGQIVPTGGTDAGVGPASLLVTALAQFDWHPILYSLTQYSGQFVTSVKYQTPMLVGDIHNLTVIDNEHLENMHRICLYSEFDSFGS